MKQSSVCAVLLAAIPLITGWADTAATAHSPGRPGVQEAEEARREINALHKAWAKARIDGDVAFLERFYASDLRIIAISGAVITRAVDIAAFARRDIKPEIVEDDDVEIRLYSDTAVATGIEHVRGTAYGQRGEFHMRFTNVLVRRNGRWQLVMHQTTQVAP